MESTTLCRNEMNAVGLCKAAYCPLANSRYATVREEKGICYLFIKTAEREKTPAKLWEKVKLSQDYMAALKQIDDHLKYWPTHMAHKCKQRLTRLVQYLIRKKRLKKKTIKKLVHVNKKVERREKSREYKALVAAKIDRNIEKELLTRLKSGLYDDIYNLNENILEKIASSGNKTDETDTQTDNIVDNIDDTWIEFVPESDLDSDIDMEDMDLIKIRSTATPMLQKNTNRRT